MNCEAVSDDVINLVTDIVKMCAGAGGLYLFVGLVATMLEAQLGSISGTPFALARVTERVILITFCLAVVVSAQGLPTGRAFLPGIADKLHRIMEELERRGEYDPDAVGEA